MAATRRERMRAETAADILAVARRQLLAGGPRAVSLRAIARDVGMTAPGLYRYFPSLDELVGALAAELYDELAAALGAAGAGLPADAAGARALAVCRAFRAWSVAHPAEFGLLFGPAPVGTPAQLEHGARRFEEIFSTLSEDLWRRFRFPVPHEVEAALAAQLDDWRERTGCEVPTPALRVLLGYWVRLYGLVSLEVAGHLRAVLGDAEALFEETLREFAEALGLDGASPDRAT
ncbi:MAG: putative HTH-type transcriptional regulator [Mycobacterium sp.]|nr:putative HTH-type transcriptional regulator [Mycobacterium sp.]